MAIDVPIHRRAVAETPSYAVALDEAEALTTDAGIWQDRQTKNRDPADQREVGRIQQHRAGEMTVLADVVLNSPANRFQHLDGKVQPRSIGLWLLKHGARIV